MTPADDDDAILEHVSPYKSRSSRRTCNQAVMSGSLSDDDYENSSDSG